MRKQLLLPMLSLLLLSRCGLFNKKDPEPQLPPATQTGANTFGCLVNGEVWLPEGRTSTFAPNMEINYEPSFRGGSLSIGGYRYRKGEVDQILAVGVDSVPKYRASSYRLQCVIKEPYRDGGGATYIDAIRNCEYYCNRDGAVLLNGICLITKLDLQAKIVSGTFAFTLAKPGCDTVKITQGRFDMKLY